MYYIHMLTNIHPTRPSRINVDLVGVPGGELDGRDEVLDGGGQISRRVHAT